MATAIVVGGGLAGMVIARELASRRWRVTLLERSPRLGGKAGSDLQHGRRVEHGCHVFPHASNYAPLASLSDAGAKDALVEEIGEYLPIKPSDVESWEINPNTQVPLFINTIGAWPTRPRPKSQVRNLYLAGDFVTNGIDLACMEGAVSAALEAACEILSDAGETEGLPVPRLPPVWPRELMVAARIGCAPAVALGT